MSQTSGMLNASITRKVEYRLAMLLERLASEHLGTLGEQVSRVGLARDVAYDDTRPAPRNSRILKTFLSTCREFWADVKRWHKS